MYIYKQKDLQFLLPNWNSATKDNSKNMYKKSFSIPTKIMISFSLYLPRFISSTSWRLSSLKLVDRTWILLCEYSMTLKNLSWINFPTATTNFIVFVNYRPAYRTHNNERYTHFLQYYNKLIYRSINRYQLVDSRARRFFDRYLNVMSLRAAQTHSDLNHDFYKNPRKGMIKKML